MRALAIALTILGGIMPVAALAWAWVAARRRFGALDADLTRIQAITREHPDPSECTPLMYAVRQPTANWSTVTYMPEEVERAILRSALGDLQGPALLAGAGAVAGMIGGLLSIYL